MSSLDAGGEPGLPLPEPACDRDGRSWPWLSQRPDCSSWNPPGPRPLDTEDTGTLEPGRSELELSTDFLTGASGRLAALRGVWSLGVLPRLEARIESAVLIVEPDGEPAQRR
jgi:hypothetical protein